MNVLQADGLTLEPLRSAHAEAMFAVLADPAIYEFENAPPPSIEWLRDRYVRLEARRSVDGSERWLNWVVRQPGGEPIGYVQATVRADGTAIVAYEFASRFWGQGLARRAMARMLDELSANYAVRTAFAIFKQRNVRSRRLLDRLGFEPIGSERSGASVEDDEALYERRIA